MAIPALIFALMLLTITGSNVWAMIVIIALLDSTRVFRLTRSVAVSVSVMECVEAARLRGEELGWTMRREVLPNIIPPLVAEFGLRFCFVFLTIAALSFLGVGIRPPTADWGTMVRDTANLMQFARFDITAGLTPLMPAACIALRTIGVTLWSTGFSQQQVDCAMTNNSNDLLLDMRNVQIEGFSDERWNPIIKGVDLQLKRGEVRENIESEAAARKDAQDLYSSLSLPSPETIGDRFPHQVSGGQLQRIMTAMAMSPRPDLIIFDEPITALDVTTQVEVLLSMRKIVREFGAGAIYIIHDLAVVAQMADRIKVLR